jgi:glycosyltransferase involved in cell wall biosynthesis
MRILHILNELKPSGAEVMLELAAPEWLRLGCDLHIFSMAKTRGVYADVLEQSGWQIHLSNPDEATLTRISDLARMVREIGPDVVHIHSEGKNLPNSFAIRRCGIPIARTVHNNFQFEGSLRQRKKLERLICRLLGVRHVAISKSVQNNELARFSNPSEVCWNWFDASSFRPPTAAQKIAARQRLGLPMDRKILVSIGNGSDVKNYAAIVEALADPGHRSLLYYQVGLPHPEGTDQALAKKHQLGASVRFYGPTDTVLDWLWACDLYVMPSVFEGLS